MHEQVSMDVVRLEDLPTIAQRLVDLIGLPCTINLVDRLGGTTFPVSHNERSLGHVRYNLLAEVVGIPAADKITSAFAGTRLYIPQCRRALQQARNRAICTEFDRLVGPGSDSSGKDAVFFLARKYRLSDRLVWQILKSTDMLIDARRDVQGTLF